MAERMKRLICNNKWCLLAIVLVLIFDIFFIFFPTYISISAPSAQGGIYPAAILEPGVEYSQKFINNIERLNSVEIRFATYGAENTTGSVLIALRSQDNVVTSQTVNLEDIPDNSTYKLAFEEIRDTKDQEYEVSISYLDYQEGNSLCFFLVDGAGYHKENGKDIPAAIFVSVNGKNKDTLRLIWWNLFIITICIAIMSASPSTKDSSRGHDAKNRRKASCEKNS